MKMLRKVFVISLVLFLVVGCGGSGGSTDTPTDAAKTSLVIATDTDLSTMDFHVATDGTSFEAITLGFAGLVELDANNQPKADLASSWEVSDDGTEYTFHLADSSWSNGTPITANDFVYGWRRLVSPEVASEYSFIIDVVKVANTSEILAGEKPVEELGVEAVDDKTLKVTLSQPVDFFLGLLAFPPFFALNEEFVTSQGDQYAVSPENMIYSGPYVMSEWTPGSGYKFVKNDQYYQKDSIDMADVSFRFVQDTQTAILEYQSGNIDLVKLSGEMVDAYKSEEGFNKILQGYLWYLSLNFTNESIQNDNLRQAFLYAIDRDTIATNVLKDGSVAAEGIIPRSLAVGSSTGNDFRDDAGAIVSYDPAKAAEYYEAAKAELGGDVSLELLYEDSEASKAVAEYIQNNLETNLPGITITLNSKPKKTRLDMMNNGEYQIALTRWGPDYADPQTYLDLFTSEASNNDGKYSSSEYDGLVYDGVSGVAATDSAARWNLFVEAEKVLVAQDAAVIPVYQVGGAYMINPAVSGFEFHSAGVNNFRHVKTAE